VREQKPKRTTIKGEDCSEYWAKPYKNQQLGQHNASIIKTPFCDSKDLHYFLKVNKLTKNLFKKPKLN
jgi:hypothetical protein